METLQQVLRCGPSLLLYVLTSSQGLGQRGGGAQGGDCAATCSTAEEDGEEGGECGEPAGPDQLLAPPGQEAVLHVPPVRGEGRVSDSEVRVSVKTLSLSCLGEVVAISPQVWQLSLLPHSEDTMTSVEISAALPGPPGPRTQGRRGQAGLQDAEGLCGVRGPAEEVVPHIRYPLLFFLFRLLPLLLLLHSWKSLNYSFLF